MALSCWVGLERLNETYWLDQCDLPSDPVERMIQLKQWHANRLSSLERSFSYVLCRRYIVAIGTLGASDHSVPSQYRPGMTRSSFRYQPRLISNPRRSAKHHSKPRSNQRHSPTLSIGRILFRAIQDSSTRYRALLQRSILDFLNAISSSSVTNLRRTVCSCSPY